MIKVLLKELGFKWNGGACNFTQFFIALRSFLHGEHQANDGQSAGNLSEFDGMDLGALTPTKPNRRQGTITGDTGKLISMLQDVFFATRKNLYELYRVGTSGQTLDFAGFKVIIADCSRCYVSDSDMEITFKHICGSLQHSMTFE